MPLWNKWFKKEEREEKVDILNNLQAILEFLEEVNTDIKGIQEQFSRLEELEKERVVAKKNLLEANLDTQAQILDKILTQYEFFQNDVDINGIRVKKIAQQFLENAKNAGLTDLVREKKKNSQWQFYW